MHRTYHILEVLAGTKKSRGPDQGPRPLWGQLGAAVTCGASPAWWNEVVSASAPELVKELENSKVNLNPTTAHDSHEAWREGGHDDLVLAVAMACWCGGAT
jgi:hypothetical protein